MEQYFPEVMAGIPIAKTQEIVAGNFAFVSYIMPLASWILYAGRILSAGIECHFCQSFFERLAQEEAGSKKDASGSSKSISKKVE